MTVGTIVGTRGYGLGWGKTCRCYKMERKEEYQGTVRVIGTHSHSEPQTLNPRTEMNRNKPVPSVNLTPLTSLMSSPLPKEAYSPP